MVIRICSKIRCRICGKATYSGCGEHIEEALQGVAPQDRCAGHPIQEFNSQTTPSQI